jgi:hypothetical protein
LVYCVAVDPEVFPYKNMQDIWYIDKINSPKPSIFHFYIDPTIEYEWEIEAFPHSVVEITPKGVISFYDMIDFDTEDPWRIDGYDSEEY